MSAVLALGRWELHERIGAGRLAHVHRATGADGEVAIKLLAPGASLDDPAAEARFRHEVAALARIDHPAVIPLIAHGVDPDLGPYLVTPLVRGRTLRRLIAAGATEPALAALAGREIAGALAAIHAAGLVHRDLKPENVMVRDDGTVVVLDLGLAWAPDQTRYTEEGAVAGSVPYMAPEQIEGGAPSPATDAWALGVILFEWITGARPFARGQASAEVAAILAGARPRLGDLDPRVPAPLAALVDACLTVRAADRPADGAVLAARLAALAPGDAAAALRDPDGFVAAEAARQAAALTAEARRLLAAGRSFAAAPLLARAARHRPDDPEIVALADQVGRTPRRRRRWLPAAVVAATALAASGAWWGLRGAASVPAAAPALDAGPAPLRAADLPEQVAPDRAALDAGLWRRGEPVLPPDPQGGYRETNVFGSREDEVATASDPAVPLAYARELFGSRTRTDEGRRVLATALARFDRHAPLWLLRGQVAMRLGAWDDAVAALDRALALAPTLVAAWTTRARLHRLHGRLRAAFVDVSAGRWLAPDDVDLLIEAVWLHAAVGRAAEARPLARRATELAPTRAAAWLALAEVSDDDEKFTNLGRAARLDSRAPESWKRLCVLGTRLQRPEAEPDCWQARILLGREDAELSMASSIRHERAGELYQAVVDLWSAPGYDQDLPMVLRAIDLYERMGEDFNVRKTRALACRLGHAPSCAAAGADSGVAP